MTAEFISGLAHPKHNHAIVAASVAGVDFNQKCPGDSAQAVVARAPLHVVEKLHEAGTAVLIPTA
jgi:hypothetical protein